MVDVIYSVVYGIFGLIIGSFLTVVIDRVPREESLMIERSHCPKCGHVLAPWELIPVLSYVWLRGKCNQCKGLIAWRYPLVESLTAGLFVLTYLLRPGRTPNGNLLDLLFVSLLIALTFIDIDTFRLPDSLILCVAALGLANIIITGEPVLWRCLVGALSAGGVFFFISYIYPKGLGLGDVKFVAALGLYLGFPEVFLSIFIASLFGVILGGLRILFFKKKLKDPIPFGPFLAWGALVMLLGKELFAGWFG